MSNPAINLETRKWLRGLVASQVLDEWSYERVRIVLDAYLAQAPSSLVRNLALDLEASDDRAMRVASGVELCYAACSFTDDLQDGDSAKVLDVSLPLAINTQTQLVCLCGYRMCGIDSFMCGEFYRMGVPMLTGQRLELERESWTMHDYLDVAERIAGLSFGYYFSTAGYSAFLGLTDIHFLQACGKAYGALLQVTVDKETSDNRFTCFGQDTQEYLVERLREPVLESVKACKYGYVRNVLNELLRRGE